MYLRLLNFFLIFFSFIILSTASLQVFAQEDTGLDDELDQGLFEDAKEEAEETKPGSPPLGLPPVVTPGTPTAEGPSGEAPTAETPHVEGGEAGEGQTNWGVSITAAVIMNYVFNDSPDSFTIKYRFEIKGQANAATAVMRGEADISADVEGPLSRWPTGECRLTVTIPKVPYELIFQQSGEEKGNIKLTFKRTISEDWQSTCTFEDAPGTRFQTRGAPEAWLTKALDKARPPLKELITNIDEEETTTRAVISKEVISDAPLGNGEMEGNIVVTTKRGGG